MPSHYTRCTFDGMTGAAPRSTHSAEGYVRPFAFRSANAVRDCGSHVWVGSNLIGLSKASRAELGVEIGDTIDATVELDTAERTVEIPDDLAAALDADRAVRATFDRLAPSKRKEFARSVSEAKKPETHNRRIVACVENVRKSLG